MTRGPGLTLSVLLLLIVPMATSASWGAEPVSFRAEAARVGDRWLFGAADGGGAVSKTILFEGITTTHDAYGFARDVDVMRAEWASGADVQHSVRCHRLQGSLDFVAADLLVSSAGSQGGGEGWSSILGIETQRDRLEINTTTVKVFDGGSCQPISKIEGRFLREGESLSYCDLLACSLPTELDDPLSAGATVFDFHGRRALRYAFDVQDLERAFQREIEMEGPLAFVLAEGLPGVVRRESGPLGAYELLGFERGTGPEATPYRGERMPSRHPDARFTQPSTRFDDSALQTVFPFASAVQAARTDPTCGLDDWFRAHPRAVLREATLDIGDRETHVPGMRADAEWFLTFADGAFVYSLRIQQTHPDAGGIAPAVAVPSYLIDDFGQRSEEPYLVPSEMLSDAPAIATMLQRQGMDAADIRSLEFRLSFHPSFPAELTVRSFSLVRGQDRRETGWVASVDMERGGLRDIGHSSLASSGDQLGPLSPPSQKFEAERPAQAFASLSQPLRGAGVGVPVAATITGVTLLALVVKFLLPLYTRLVRNRLLDNPVRARLYDRIRAEPGIHLAELEEFLGVGKGATKHHVDQLVRHRFVFVVGEAGKSRCYAAGHIPVEVARQHALLRAGSNQRVYDLLRAEPDLSLRAAAERLGMSAPSVHRIKKRLERKGLLPAAP